MIYSDAEAKHLVSQELFVEKMNELAAAMGGGGGGGADDYVVTMNIDLSHLSSPTGTCDKTYSEIMTAVNGGKNIVCVINSVDTIDIPAFTVVSKMYGYAQSAFMTSFLFLMMNPLIVQVTVAANGSVHVSVFD